MEQQKGKSACLVLVVMLAFVVTSQIQALSFEDSKEGKEDYYNFLVESRAHGKVYDGKELREECKDRLPSLTCKVNKPFCENFKIIKEMCAETCGVCKRAYYPLLCEFTKFGCCWDNVTKSEGPNKAGCPACIDTHPECKYVKDRCADRAPVRRLCPITCGIQCETCEDDPYQAEVCSYYKMAGFCQVDPGLMKKHCKKTCGFCS